MIFSHLIIEALPDGGCSVSTVTQETAEAYTGDGVAILRTDAPEGDPEYWTLNPGDPLPTYDAAAQAAEEAAENEQFKKELRAGAFMQQFDLGFDWNFSIVLGLAEMKAATAAQPIAPKAQACIDKLNELWAEYETRKTNKTKNFDFKGVGSKPHTYDEVVTEFKGA